MKILNSFKDYLFSQDKTPSQVTIKNYFADVKKFVSWIADKFGDNYPLQKVTPLMLSSYKDFLLQTFSPTSVERQFSALRKFFQFLKTTSAIEINPFDLITISQQQSDDKWHLKSFKNYLVSDKSSDLTIKNYIIDIKQFIEWLCHKIGEIDSTSLFNIITTSRISEYKQFLLQENMYSASSINRKLSSLRKYMSWLEEKKIINPIIEISESVKTNEKQQEINLHSLISQDIEVNQKVPTANESVVSYSKFPPLRMIQKIIYLYSFLSELLVITPVSELIKFLHRTHWNSKGKPIFTEHKATFPKKTDTAISSFSELSTTIYSPFIQKIQNQAFIKKIWFHIKYTRPIWFIKYQKSSLSTYFNFVILFILCSAIVLSIYNAFILKSIRSLALTNGASPPRILSFQGRLTDASDNPITTATDLRFAIYNDSTATGAALLWQEADYRVSPDSNGIFSVILGNGSTIGATVFSQNATLYLGVTVGLTAELSPRQQLATVPFASNAETVQGLYPITDTTNVTTNKNTVLALNASGVLDIPGSSNTIFQSTSGQFTLTGRTLTLNTASGTGTNIQLAPDGQGLVDIQKPITNTTFNNNIRSAGGASTAAGAVEIDQKLAVLATSSGQSAFTIDQEGLGPVISASHSGSAVFTVDNSGNVTANAFNVGLGTTYFINNTTSSLNALSLAGNLTVSGNVASSLVPSANNTYDLGSSTSQWRSIYANNLLLPVSGGTEGFWQLASNVIAPSNTINDLAVGGNSTSSAKFQVFGASGNATSSGTLTFTSANNAIQSTANQNLTLGGTTTGNIILNPLNSTGNVGINQTNPSENLDIASSTNANILLEGTANSATSELDFQSKTAGGATNKGSISLSTGGNIFFNANGFNSNLRLGIFKNGNVTVGNITTARAFLDIRNNSTNVDQTQAAASISAQTSYAGLVVDQYGAGDILTASQAGVTKFTVLQNGNLVANNYTTGGGVIFATNNGLIQQTASGSTGNCLQSAGGGTPTWGSCGSGSNSSQWVIGGGTLSPVNNTLDLVYGSATNATGSAKFAVLNINSGTPTASVSATGTGTALSIAGDGTIQSALNGNLTIGGATTGNITLSPLNGATGSKLTVNALTESNAATAINFTGTNPVIAATATNSTLQLNANGNGIITLNSGATGNIQFFSSSNTISSSGNMTLAGTISVNQGGSAATKTSIDTNGNILPGTSGGANIGSSSLPWGTIYGNNFITTASSGSNGFLQLNSNVLSPTNLNYDLAVGTSATSSAAFQVFALNFQSGGVAGVTIPAGTASMAGNLTFSGGGSQKIDLLNNSSLNFYNSVGGNGGEGTNIALSITNTSNIGIGTTNPQSKLTVSGGDISLDNNTSYRSKDTGGSSRAILTLDNTSGGNILHLTNNANGKGGPLVFETQKTQGESMRITSLGYVGIGTTLMGNTGLVVNQSNNAGTGDIFSASSGAITKFTISNGGAITDTNYTTGGGVLFADSTGLFTQTGTSNSSQCLIGGTTPSWATCATGANGTQYWQLNAGAVSPANSTNDFLIGANSTSSATFGLLNVASGNPTATIAGNFSIVVPSTANQNVQLGALNGDNFKFQTSVGGDTGLATRLYIANGGNIGVNTISPLATLDVNGSASVSSTLLFDKGGSDAQLGVLNGFGLKLQTSLGGDTGLTTREYIGNNGNVGINTITPTAKLDVNGTASVSGQLALYGTPTIQSTANQNLTLGGNTTGNIILSPLNTTGSVLPSTNDVTNIGSSGTEFNNVYAKTVFTPTLDTAAAAQLNIGTTNATTLQFGNANTTAYTFNAGNNSTVNINGTRLQLGNGSTANIQATGNSGITLLSSGTGNLVLGQNSGSGNVRIIPNAGGQAALWIDSQGGNGDILSASSAGTTKFTIQSTGAIKDTNYTNAGGVFYADSTGLLTQTSGGSSSQCLLGGATPGWGSCSAGANFWQLNAQSTVVSPANVTQDLAIGGNATNSADFQVFSLGYNNGTTVTAGTATTSGNLVFYGTTPRVNVLNGDGLNIRTSTGGDSGLTTSLFVGNNASVGIGNANQSGLHPGLTIGTNAGSASPLTLFMGNFNNSGTNGQGQIVGNWHNASTGWAIGTINNTTNDQTLRLGVSSDTIGTWNNNQDINLQIGGTLTSTALAAFDLRRSASTVAIASISGNSSFAALTVDNSGIGDLFTASSSGKSRFEITQAGKIGIGTVTPTAFLDVNGTASVSGQLALYGTPTIQATANQVLTLGGATTGNIILSPLNGGAGSILTLNALTESNAATAVNLTGTNPVIAATATNSTLQLNANGNGTLTLNSGTTGDIRFFGSSNTLTNAGNLTLAGTASVSGQFTVYGTPTIQATGNQTFTLGGNTTGNILLSPLNGTGNIGVNTTTPTANLDVNGTASVSGQLALYGTPTIQATANQVLTLGGATTGNIILSPLNGTGKIGIGTTTNPTATVDINAGALKFNSNSVTSTGAITLTAAAASTWSTSTGNLTISSGTSGILNLQSGSTSGDSAQIKFLDSGGTVRARIDVNSPYGNGADGAISVSSSTNINTTAIEAGRPTCLSATACADGIAYRVNAPTVGATSVTRFSGSDTLSNGIAAGDEVLLINLQGSNAATDAQDVGKYQFMRVSSVTASTITFNAAIGVNLTGVTAANQKVVVQRVPNYTNVTLSSSGSITASAFEGLTTTPANGAGYLTGIVAFRATGTVTVASGTTILADNLGYRGGAGGVSGANGGTNGEGIDGQPGSGGSGATAGTNGGGMSGNGAVANPANGTAQRSGGGGGGASGNGVSTAGGGGGAGGGNGNGGGGGGGSGSTAGAAGANNGGNGGGGGGGSDTAGTGGAGGQSSAGANATGGTNNGIGGSVGTATKGASGGGGANNTIGGGGGGGGGFASNTSSTGSLISLGGGGGGGGGSTNTNTAGGAGGQGGGIIFISATTISANTANSITARGQAGVGGTTNSGTGGGGAGGTVYLQAATLTIGSGNVLAGGAAKQALVGKGGGGGQGGQGVIFLASSATNLGATGTGITTTPSFNNIGPLDDGGTLYVRAVNNAGADLAENYTTGDNSLEAGDVVKIADAQVTLENGKTVIPKGILVKANREYDQKSLGIISTDPGVLLGNPDTSASQAAEQRKLALAGRVPVKVSTINGAIMAGDYITTSSIPGVAMKATKAGVIIAQALEPYTNTDTQAIGKITAFVHNGFYDPQVILTDTGDINIIANTASESGQLDQVNPYHLQDIAGNFISRVGLFSELAVAKLRTGFIDTQSLAANNITIAGQSLKEYILNVVNESGLALNNNHIISPLAEVSNIHTNIISPLGKNASIAIKLDNNQVSIVKDASSAAVAVIDNQGNASFSGTLKSNNLAVNSDATVSGTLYAHKIIADDIVGLSEKVSTLAAQNITNVTNIIYATPSGNPLPLSSSSGQIADSNLQSSLLNSYGNYQNIASYSGFLSYVPHLQATTAEFEQGLMSLGPTSLSDTTITGQLSIGSQFILSDNSINVLGGDLQLQPLRQGGISFMGGKITIDHDGNLAVNGKAFFQDTLAAKIISPLAGNDLQIKLGENKNGSEINQSKLTVHNASDSAVFAINQLGDILASGAATISKLNFNVIAPVQAVSENEVIATSSAGTASINPFQRELTIDSGLVTENSLIYITPVGTPSAQNPFLLRQVPAKSFTVGVPQPADTPTQFNWLIIN